MDKDIYLRFYGPDTYDQIWSICQEQNLNFGWELEGRENYPLLVLKPWAFERVKDRFKDLELEYDDVTPVDKSGKPCPYIRPKKLIITYTNKDKQINFEYHETVPQYTIYHSASYWDIHVKGTVPHEVVQRGKDAIQEYARGFVTRSVDRKWKKYRKSEERDRTINVPVSVEYEGQLLEGRIVSTEDSALTVKMDSPYSGQAFVVFGWGSAMSGRYIHNEDGSLTQEAFQSANKLLIKIYKKEKTYQDNKEVVDLVEELNKQ